MEVVDRLVVEQSTPEKGARSSVYCLTNTTPADAKTMMKDLAISAIRPLFFVIVASTGRTAPVAGGPPKCRRWQRAAPSGSSLASISPLFEVLDAARAKQQPA